MFACGSAYVKYAAGQLAEEQQKMNKTKSGLKRWMVLGEEFVDMELSVDSLNDVVVMQGMWRQ